MGSTPLAVAADLGSTSIKVGLLDRDGRLRQLASVAAPPLSGIGSRCEGVAEAYALRAEELLRSAAARLPAGIPLGVATQRSSFTVWDRGDGRPRFPLVSWQDRRAADWCERHRALEAEVVRRTGLLLSAHYAGPKLAAMQEEDEAFRTALHDGRHAWGTLESLLAWRWSDGACHQTDGTVAARTALVDLEGGDWSESLLEQFGVPRAVLPDVTPTCRATAATIAGLELKATISDQGAAALAMLDPGTSTALVNLGTGAFVLAPATATTGRLPGYLLAPILSEPGSARYVLEGTVNGAGPAVDACGPPPTALAATDPDPRAFALPDRAGLGSPYWRPEVGLSLSSEARELAPAAQRRVMLEGLLFRLRQILEDLHDGGLPASLLLSGGLVRDPAVAAGLAALLRRPVEVLKERESGLLAASRLAAGLAPFAGSATDRVEPTAAGGYLPEKYTAWRDWLDRLLVD